MQIAIEKYKTQILGKINVKPPKKHHHKLEHKRFTQYLQTSFNFYPIKKHYYIKQYFFTILKFKPFKLDCFLDLIQNENRFTFTLLKLKNEYYILVFQHSIASNLLYQRKFLQYSNNYYFNVCSQKESIKVIHYLNSLLNAKEYPSYLETHYQSIIGIKDYNFKKYDINSLAFIITKAQKTKSNLSLNVRAVSSKNQCRHQFTSSHTPYFYDIKAERLVKGTYFKISKKLPKQKIAQRIKILNHNFKKSIYQPNFYIPINMQKQLIKNIVILPSRLKYPKFFTIKTL